MQGLEQLVQACEAETNGANSLNWNSGMNISPNSTQCMHEVEPKSLRWMAASFPISEIYCRPNQHGSTWTNSLTLSQDKTEFRLTIISSTSEKYHVTSPLDSCATDRKRNRTYTSAYMTEMASSTVTSTSQGNSTSAKATCIGNTWVPQLTACVDQQSSGRDQSAHSCNSSTDSDEFQGYGRSLNGGPRSRASSRRSTQGRTTFSAEQIATLKQYLVSRWYCPYFDTEEMNQIAENVNLTKNQVHNWLRTFRSRKWREACEATAPHIFQLVTSLVEKKILKAIEMVQSLQYVFGDKNDIADIVVDPECIELCKDCKRKHKKYLSEQNFTKVRTKNPDLADLTPYADHAPFEVLDSLNS